MTATWRSRILRANALYLLLAAIGGLRLDVLAVSLTLWRAAPARSWHLSAAGIHVLLGTANLLLWPMLFATDLLAARCLAAGLHWAFVALQLVAAASVPSSGSSTGSLAG